MNEENKNTLPSNSFMSVLQRKELQESLITELSVELGKIALAVKQTGKKGVLQLALTVEREKGNALSITAQIISKVPSTAAQALTIFYVDKDGALTRTNPDQTELSLQSHDGGLVGQAAPSATEATA